MTFLTSLLVCSFVTDSVFSHVGHLMDSHSAAGTEKGHTDIVSAAARQGHMAHILFSFCFDPSEGGDFVPCVPMQSSITPAIDQIPPS